jgi:hypothetical protein
MPKGSLFVGWGSIIPGREKAASSALQDAMSYLGSLQHEGTIDGFEAVLLEPHGGDLEGFVLVRGDKDALARLRGQEEFLRTIVGVQLVHTKVGVVTAYSGAEMLPLLAIWDQQESRLLR